MKHHMLALGGAAFDGSTGLVTVPIIADDVIRTSVNIAQLIQDWDLMWTYFGAVGLSRVRLNSSTTRIQGFPNMSPFMALSTGGDNPAVNDMRQSPLRLRNGENVNWQATTAAAVATLGLACLATPGDSLMVPNRNLRKIRFTATPTTVAFGWSAPVNVTLDDDLEPGTYAVYGMAGFQATVLAARLVFNDQVERPGCLSNQVVTERPWPVLMGGLGEWGRFNSISPPFIQTLANAAAGVTYTGYLLTGKVA